MGKMRDWIINTIKEDDDDYEYDENGHLIQEDISVRKAIDKAFDVFFFSSVDEEDEKTNDVKDNLPEYDSDGKRIIYVYDKNFDPKNYKTSLNCVFKKHPLSDELEEPDGLYSDSEKVIKLSDYRR